MMKHKFKLQDFSFIIDAYDVTSEKPCYIITYSQMFDSIDEAKEMLDEINKKCEMPSNNTTGELGRT